MSGRMSRNKGKRNEYEVRDLLRALGFIADRVPSSGAAQGFKGDIRFSLKERTWIMEVKARKATFKSIYEIPCTNFTYQNWLVGFSTDPRALLLRNDLSFPYLHPDFEKKYKRTLNKIINLEKLLKGADILAVKDDRRPFLFLTFKDYTHAKESTLPPA